jgi:hypothetical protein
MWNGYSLLSRVVLWFLSHQPSFLQANGALIVICIVGVIVFIVALVLNASNLSGVRL